uniref:Uncharacterized protein n=1 Tax=Romanomermis culicivorax TaxID=13658 RepID=A0A915I6W4_ROMCU
MKRLLDSLDVADTALYQKDQSVTDLSKMGICSCHI